jgi:hypothetical protein
MKKILFTMLCGLVFSLTSQAQTQDRLPFAKDKFYTAASMSGFDLNWNKNQSWHMNLDAKCGYLFEDDWMITGNIGFDWFKAQPNAFTAGAGLRYYIEQNGLYLGAGANYLHNSAYDDFVPTCQLGYAYFLNRTVTIEPEVYYNLSLKDYTNYSGFGFRISLGIYFE